jgi:hypothetical protein
MKFENLKEFIKNTKCSKSKIYRFYKKDEDLFAETKLKNGKRVFPCDHAKYFNSEVMFSENKILKKENHQMKNLLDCLVDRNSMPSVMYGMEWSLFITVAYRAERNKKSCFKQMHGLYEMLILKYGGESSFRMFFVTEPFTNRVGFTIILCCIWKTKNYLKRLPRILQLIFDLIELMWSLIIVMKLDYFIYQKEALKTKIGIF